MEDGLKDLKVVFWSYYHDPIAVERQPCKRCRVTRRKCVWPQLQLQHQQAIVTGANDNGNSYDSCLRCAKSRLQCIPINPTDESNADIKTDGTIDGQSEILQWQLQLQDIEVNLEEMKENVKDLLSANRNNGIKRPENLKWNLYIDDDGYVRLGTTIENLDEFLLYTQASIRYLSPFHGIFETERIRLESSTASIAIASMSRLFRDVINRPQRRQHTISYRKTTSTSITVTKTTTCEVICSINKTNDNGDDDDVDDDFYRNQMDKLISLYLEHINPIFGLLHTPTFETYYKSFADPMDCPIALSLCVEAAVMLRSRANLSPVASRRIADYFYYKCKDVLSDIFDDPKHSLETVMTITFLLLYLINVRVDCVEARFYVTISLLLCSQLEDYFQQYDSDDGDQFEKQQQRQHNFHSNRYYQKETGEILIEDPMVGRVMFQRHRLEATTNNRLIELFLNGQIDFTAVMSADIQVLNDEPQRINDHYTVYNAMLSLFRIPYMNTLLQQVNRAMHGESSDLQLDFILQFETVICKWWSELPSKLRVCDNPYTANISDVLDNNQKQDFMQIAPFALLHLWTAITNSSILKAHISSSSHDLRRVLREKAASTTWASCQAAVLSLVKCCEVYGNHLMSTPFFHIVIHFDFLRLLYALSNLVTYDYFHIESEDMQEILRKCHIVLENCFPDHHQAPLGYNKLEDFMKSINISRNNEEKGLEPLIPLDVYDECPLFGPALLSDLCSTSLHQLERLSIKKQ